MSGETSKKTGDKSNTSKSRASEAVRTDITTKKGVAKKSGKNPEADAAVSGKKVATFAVVGVGLTIFDFIVYNIALRVLYDGNSEGASVATMISGIVAMVAAYFAHKNITWKTRRPRKYGVAWFFGWNILMSVAIRPGLSWMFGTMGWLYEFAFSIISWLNIPLEFEFVKSTGIFGLATAVMMILNYIFYEKLVFGKEE